MKRIGKIIALGMVLAMTLGLTACGSKFDAAGYVKATLDANYKEDYADYAKFRNISEDDAKAEITEAFETSIKQAAAGQDVSEDGINRYSEEIRKAYALAKYEVGEAKKNDDDSYTVTVKVTPADVFQKTNAAAESVAMDYVNGGGDVTKPDALIDILCKATEQGISESTYGQETTIEVAVTSSDGGKTYGIEDATMETIEETLFPGEK